MTARNATLTANEVEKIRTFAEAVFSDPAFIPVRKTVGSRLAYQILAGWTKVDELSFSDPLRLPVAAYPDLDLPGETIIANWREPEIVLTALERGYDTILAPYHRACYLDYKHLDTILEPGRLDVCTVTDSAAIDRPAGVSSPIARGLWSGAPARERDRFFSDLEDLRCALPRRGYALYKGAFDEKDAMV